MKKRYFITVLFLLPISIAIFLLNLFVIFLPEYIAIIYSVIILLALVLFFLKGNGKWLSKTLLSIFSLLSILFCLFSAYCFPYWNNISMKSSTYDHTFTKEHDQVITYADAKSDLAYLLHYVSKLHPRFVNGVPQEVQGKYKTALSTLKQMNDSGEVISSTTVYELSQSILSVLHDAHTTSFTCYENPHKLRGTDDFEYRGLEITHVNNISLEDILAKHPELYCYETKSWALHQLSNDLKSLEKLQMLGFNTDQGVQYTCRSITEKYSDDSSKTFTYATKDYIGWNEYNSTVQTDDQSKDSADAFVSYEIKENQDLAILTLNQCNFNDTYINCVKQMFKDVKDKGIHNVAVDLRNNSGGNSQVANEFIRYLDIDKYHTDSSQVRLGFYYSKPTTNIYKNKKYSDLTFKGDVYVLTSSGTFSSAMMFAEYIKDNKLGTLIGEAPGNAATGYGDIVTFVMPHSKLYFQVSTKHFTRADQTTTDQLIEPDIPCSAQESMDQLYEKLHR